MFGTKDGYDGATVNRLNGANDRIMNLDPSARAIVWFAALKRMERDADYSMLGAIEDALDFDLGREPATRRTTLRAFAQDLRDLAGKVL